MDAVINLMNMETDDRYINLTDRGDMALMRETSYGNEEAFMVLLDRYLELVSRTSFRILCDREDSESVTVKVLVSLWNDVLDYDDRYTLAEWLLRKTCVYCRVRITRRRILRIFGVTTDLFVRASPKVEDHDDYVVKKAWELFCRASLQMTPLQSAAYVLCSLEGLEISEAARIIGLSDSRISRALHRASDKIRGELRHWGKGEDYDKFTGFLRKVDESLTDRQHLISEIIGRLNILHEK